jgi:hypothetical protein
LDVVGRRALRSPTDFPHGGCIVGEPSATSISLPGRQDQAFGSDREKHETAMQSLRQTQLPTAQSGPAATVVDPERGTPTILAAPIAVAEIPLCPGLPLLPGRFSGAEPNGMGRERGVAVCTLVISEERARVMCRDFSRPVSAAMCNATEPSPGRGGPVGTWMQSERTTSQSQSLRNVKVAA